MILSSEDQHQLAWRLLIAHRLPWETTVWFVNWPEPTIDVFIEPDNIPGVFSDPAPVMAKTETIRLSHRYDALHDAYRAGYGPKSRTLVAMW